MTSHLRAIRVEQRHDDAAARGILVDLPDDAPGSGDVVIRTVHSAVNYKDALAVTGRAPIMRRLPCIAGIEAYGTVEHSADARFILRGVQLLGINANSPMPLRRELWARIAGPWRPRALERFAQTIELADVPAHCERQLRGETRGRAVIRFD